MPLLQDKMAFVGAVWHELFFNMGKRGPKPPDLGSLDLWEFEFYKAFHVLRDGSSLPIRYSPPSSLSLAETRSFVDGLEGMTPAKYWLTQRRVAVELDEKVNLKRPPTAMDLWEAENQRKEEIYWMRRTLQPPKIEAQTVRREIWNNLIQATTYATVRRACDRWAQLRDVRGAGLACFPGHVVTNAAAFLSMKRNQRYPRSTYADDSRLEYLARGMAGAVLGMSPMTAIERLRNMKHAPGGPLWIIARENYTLPQNEQYCTCWRCRIENSNRASQFTRIGYENGLRLFMQLSETTGVPKEWNRATSGLKRFSSG